MPELALLLGVDGDWLNPELLIPSLPPPLLGMEGGRWLECKSRTGRNSAVLEEGLSFFMRLKPEAEPEDEGNDNVDEDEEDEELESFLFLRSQAAAEKHKEEQRVILQIHMVYYPLFCFLTPI
jgi:hypothetical protein